MGGKMTNIDKNTLCVLIPTYKRNTDLIKLLKSILNFNSNTNTPYVVIFDNDPKNNIKDKVYEILGSRCAYIQHRSNIGPCENIIGLLNFYSNHEMQFEKAMLVSDDDYFIKAFNKMNQEGYCKNTDMHLLNSIVRNEKGVEKGVSFPFLMYSAMYSKNRIVEHVRVLSGCVLSKELVKKYLNIINQSSVIRSEMYPMQVWAILANDITHDNSFCIEHIVGNQLHWGDYDHCEEFISSRLLTYKALEEFYPNHKILRNVKKIFILRIIKDKEKYPCLESVEVQSYSLISRLIEKILSNFSSYFSRVVVKIIKPQHFKTTN